MTHRFFLPDFCTTRNVVAVVVVAQLTAVVLTLARPAGAEPWLDLLRLSLFIQWIALMSAAVLCMARGWLAGLVTQRAVAAAFALLVVVALLVAEASWWAAQWTGIGAGLMPSTRAEFLLRTLGLSLVVSAVVLRYLWEQHQWREQVRRESRTRLAALQARIRPHFLFNSMNTIAALTRSDPVAAEEATEDLADLFRASLGDGGQRVPLADELHLCRRYERIERLRFGDRLRVEWAVDDLPRDALVPGLLIQPLLENAIYHGVEPSPVPVTVRLAGTRAGAMLSIMLSNPLAPDPTTPHQGMHIALDNVSERLALNFPGAGRLETRTDDGMFTVTLTFPYETEHADTDRR